MNRFRFRIHWTPNGHRLMVLNVNHGPWMEGQYRYPWLLWGKMENGVWYRYYYDYKGKVHEVVTKQ